MDYLPLENNDPLDKSEASISLLEHITPLAQEINCLDLKRIAKLCINDIRCLVGAKFSSLYVLDDKSNILHLQLCNHPFHLNRIVSLNQTPPPPMVIAAKSKTLVMIGDIDTHNKPVIRKSQRCFSDNYKTNNCVIAPLVCQGRVVGVLNLADKVDSSGFNCQDIALIELFSQLVGASIGNIKLFEKMQHQAITDGLTGLLNHKTFYDCLEKEQWRSRRYGGHISLIMVDIDNLKRINDKYGHRAGDKVIREISKRVKNCIRQIDTAARYGGDEFAVILPNTPLDDSLAVAKRMVESVSNLPVIWHNKEIQTSVSVGVGEYDASFSPENISIFSDQALYTAKQAGKNTVRVYSSPTQPD